MNRSIQALAQQSHLSVPVYAAIVKASQNGSVKQLAILAEKNLLNGHVNEQLKERGLTVMDALVGTYTEDNERFVDDIFHQWNERLGSEVFA